VQSGPLIRLANSPASRSRQNSSHRQSKRATGIPTDGYLSARIGVRNWKGWKELVAAVARLDITCRTLDQVERQLIAGFVVVGPVDQAVLAEDDAPGLGVPPDDVLERQPQLEDGQRAEQDIGMTRDPPRHLRRVRARHPAGVERRDQLRDLFTGMVADLAPLTRELRLVELPLRAGQVRGRGLSHGHPLEWRLWQNL